MNDEGRYFSGASRYGVSFSREGKVFRDADAAEHQITLLKANGWLVGDLEVVELDERGRR